MKKIMIAALVPMVLATFSNGAHAAADHNRLQLAQAAPTVLAEVRKVDKESRKITLKHGEITNLNMPPMTMVFSVKDNAMLDKVKVGDRVRFAAAELNGVITITALELGQ